MNRSENQIPVLSFLNKHKWRIIIPLLFALFYFAIPRYQTKTIAVQQQLFIKSSLLSQDELTAEVDSVKKQIFSEGFLRHLIVKYDAAMWMKSPAGNLIEFVIKIAKP